jgi:broad specificity phosphatase PhoE
VNFSAGLRDRDYGRWAGALTAEVVARFGSIDQAPGVEPWGMFRDRVVDAFLVEVALSQGGPTVVVAHEAVNQALLEVLAGLDRHAPQRTGCWNELHFLDGERSAVALDQRP